MRAFLYLLTIPLMLVSCGKEDALQPDFKLPSSTFMPSGDDQSPEAQLQRSFFENTGSYLLFNDTLQREYLGDDINGDPRYFIETIDLLYSVGQSTSATTRYSYTYLTTFEQKEMVAEFLQDYVLSHLQNSARPYSWFVCNVITGITNLNQVMRPYAQTNQRCIAVAANYLILRNRTDAQKEMFAQTLLSYITSQMAVNHYDQFSDFFKFSNTFYGRLGSDFGYQTLTPAVLNNLGFISSGSTTSFPSASQDLTTYATLITSKTEEQLEQSYGQYDVIMQKLRVMREVFVKIGYVF